MLKSHPDIDMRQFLMVHFIGFGAHSLDLEIYCFTHATKLSSFRDVQQDIFLKIRDIIAEEGAEVAFPSQTLFVRAHGTPLPHLSD